MVPSFRVRSLAFAAVLLPALLCAQSVPQPIQDALKRADEAVAAIIAVPDGQRTFANTLDAFDALQVKVDNDTSLFVFMQYVSPDAATRDQARAADEALSAWYVNLGKNEALFKAIKAFADSKPKLSGEDQRLLDFTLRDFRRSGMALPEDKRAKLKELELEMNRLGIEFDKNIAEDATRLPFVKEELPGVPEGVLGRQRRAADLYLIGMDGPSYGGVMDYCENADTRKKMWVSYRRRAMTKNVSVLERLIKLRAEAANVLGFKNTTDWMIETRMAKNSDTVAKFYADLEPIVRKKALVDLEEFSKAKRDHLKQPDAEFNPWDYAFYKNQLLRDKYAVDTEKVAEYFPVQNVIDGLFSITQSLYGVEYRDITSKAKDLGMPLWHEDVKFYEVVDKASGKQIGRFYLDLFPRDNKYNHAAHWGLQPRKRWADGTVQNPLSALVCNFTKPTGDKPALMPHDEVETFFHEFGHCLHAMLTESNHGRFSGTGTARDFVEAPSQMFENWVWNLDVLKTFAKHYKTGETIPDELVEGMIAARTLGSGMEAQGQLFLGMMDQAYHTAPDGVVDTTKVGLDIYAKTTVYKPVEGTAFQAAFGHLNGYHGAYYGYLWSLVFAQDMFQRFEELGMLNPEAGKYYRSKVLSKGGTVEEMDMLKDYLGREPKMDAFLKHLGLGK